MADNNNTPFTCIVSADLFRRASAGVSTDECRYYLNGVYVEACPEGGALMTATDGHMLVSIRDPHGIVEGAGIVKLNKAMKAEVKGRPASGLTQDRVLMVKSEPGVRVAYVADIDPPHTPKGGEKVLPRQTAHGLFAKPDQRVAAAQFGDVTIDGTFPDWKRLVPVNLNWSAPVAPFNPALVARIAAALAGHKGSAIQIVGQGDLSQPHIVLGQGAMSDWEGFGILMPVRDGSVPKALPAWAPRPAEVAKAA